MTVILKSFYSTIDTEEGKRNSYGVKLTRHQNKKILTFIKDVSTDQKMVKLFINVINNLHKKENELKVHEWYVIYYYSVSSNNRPSFINVIKNLHMETNLFEVVKWFVNYYGC